MKITANRLMKLGCGPDCSHHQKFLGVFPRGAEPTWANISKARAAGLEVGRLAMRGALSRSMTKRLLPLLDAYWRGRVVCDCRKLTREDVLAALPLLDAYWRGTVVHYCPTLTREDVLAALPLFDAYWRGTVVRGCQKLTREDVLAALPLLDADWRWRVVRGCPCLTAEDRKRLMREEAMH